MRGVKDLFTKRFRKQYSLLRQKEHVFFLTLSILFWLVFNLFDIFLLLLRGRENDFDERESADKEDEKVVKILFHLFAVLYAVLLFLAHDMQNQTQVGFDKEKSKRNIFQCFFHFYCFVFVSREREYAIKWSVFSLGMRINPFFAS